MLRQNANLGLSGKGILIIMLLLSLSVSLWAEKVVIRIENPDKQTIEYFYSNNYDVAALTTGYIDLVIDKQMLIEITELGYEYEIVQTETQMKKNIVIQRGKDIPGYRDYNDMLTELQQLAFDHPDIVQLFDIGDSRGKEYYNNGNNNYANYQHDIWCVKLSDNVTVNEDEQNVIFDGEHHAREPISMEMVMLILNYLVDNYGTDPDVTFWVDNSQIWFVPLINPNGHKIVIDQTDLWWRKNIHDNDGNGQITWSNGWDYPDGVDLNRNYGPPQWWGGAGTSGPTGQTYPGTGSFSEPETQALRDLLLSYRFSVGMSYHSYSELIMYPLGFNMSCVAPDVNAFANLCQEMAMTVPAQGGGYYTPQQCNQLYPCSGTTTDYGYGVLRIFYYITELGTEFIPPASTMEQIIQNNLSAALLLLDRVFYSTITGNITNVNTGEPVVAQVKIPSIDNTGTPVEPYLSGEDFGRYYRILLPGTYDMEISAFGYLPDTVNNVVVNNTEQTIVNVALTPAPTTTVTITVQNEDGDPIVGAEVEFLNTSIEPEITNLNGQVIFDNIPYGNYQVSVATPASGTFNYAIEVTATSHQFTFIIAEPVWTDGFEEGLGNWSAQYPWGVTTAYAYNGLYSATDSPYGNYGNNISTSLTLNNPIDLTDAISAQFRFMTRYDIEAGYDYCYVEVSTNGTTWNTLASFTGTQSTWVEKDYDLLNYLGEHVYVRFKLVTDTYVTEDGIYIDDFMVYVNEYGTPVDFNEIPMLTTKLYQNYPNPFNPETVIAYQLPEGTEVEISIYNILGQKVKTLVNGRIDAGYHKVIWNGKDADGNDVSSGIYFYKINTDKFSETKKMLLMK